MVSDVPLADAEHTPVALIFVAAVVAIAELLIVWVCGPQ